MLVSRWIYRPNLVAEPHIVNYTALQMVNSHLNRKRQRLQQFFARLPVTLNKATGVVRTGATLHTVDEEDIGDTTNTA